MSIDLNMLHSQQASMAYFSKPMFMNARTLQSADYRIEFAPLSKVTIIIGSIFALFIFIYYAIWVWIHVIDGNLLADDFYRPSEASIVAVVLCLWMLSLLIFIYGYLKKRRLPMPPFLYFSCLAAFGICCHYAMMLQYVRNEIIAPDSTIFLFETAIVGMSIINIAVYTALICIEFCFSIQERKLRYEYLSVQRAIVTQPEYIQHQRIDDAFLRK